jgi:hypothetical protein
VCAVGRRARQPARRCRRPSNGKAATSADTERLIASEAIQEHLWRVMLDWPKLLGLPQDQQRFAGWYAMLRKIGAGEIDMPVFLHEFQRDGLGIRCMNGERWIAMTRCKYGLVKSA